MGFSKNHPKHDTDTALFALKPWIIESTSARDIGGVDLVQPLWKGYGAIYRVYLEGAQVRSVIVKHIRLAEAKNGENRTSHQRKVESYRVELRWYLAYGGRCDGRCRIPHLVSYLQSKTEIRMILEDLDEAGFHRRVDRPSFAEIEMGLRWLSAFHAAFLGRAPDGLFATGTYWHLGTRKEEFLALEDETLKAAAFAIDERLKNTFQTLVHGDAKIENFCFAPNGGSSEGDRIAAVDFQYVGGGCGMKDVAYFVSSCMDDKEAERREAVLLDLYFEGLRSELTRHSESVDAEALEREWRACYRVAWADFHRFYKAWSGLHFPEDGYSERVTRQVAQKLLSSRHVLKLGR